MLNPSPDGVTKSKPKRTPHLVEQAVAQKLEQAERTVKQAQTSIERSKKLIADLREAQRRRRSNS